MTLEDKKAKLFGWLQTALELELATIPPYLVALLSIKLEANRAAANLIRSVMIEEMLHIALVANVMNALGGAPRIDATSAPTYPYEMCFEGKVFANRRFEVVLAPFSQSTIELFCKIEEPLEPIQTAAQRKALEGKIEIPGLTIGDFYANVVALLDELYAEGGSGIFSGNPSRQLTPDYYWSGGGSIIPVHDLASAKSALNLVISQGEGAWVPSPERALQATELPTMGHYYRFAEILFETYFQDGDSPLSPPTGAPLVVDYSAVWPVRVGAKLADYPANSPLAIKIDLFNRRYTAMLQQLHQALNGSPITLYTAVMDGMHGLTPLAREIMSTPIDSGCSSPTGCPSFEWTN